MQCEVRLGGLSLIHVLLGQNDTLKALQTFLENPDGSVAWMDGQMSDLIIFALFLMVPLVV